MIKITLNKSDYEPFFDFIKAYAILCVLMGHTIPFFERNRLQPLVWNASTFVRIDSSIPCPKEREFFFFY